MPSRTRHILSLFHNPTDACRDAFYSVVRAGHVIAGPEHRFDRESHPGHEIILCLKGRGFVRQHARVHPIGPGEAVWVNRHHPHAYWAEERSPWEVYWLLFDGPQLELIWRLLLEAGGPVVAGCDHRQKREGIERIFALLQNPPPALAPRVHAEVAHLIALLLEALDASRKGPHTPRSIPDALRKPLERMRIYHHLPLRLRELADLAGMSESHFARTFRQVTGASPIEWLRRERITHARRRLLETTDSMKQIARQVGYGDQFYFSRDFKRVTSHTPTAYRAMKGVVQQTLE